MEQRSLTAAWRETHQAVLIYPCVSLEVPLRQFTPSALQVIISEHSLRLLEWGGGEGAGCSWVISVCATNKSAGDLVFIFDSLCTFSLVRVRGYISSSYSFIYSFVHSRNSS